ncbi:hypothetical protein Ae406Ps2_6410 [Pseudonocardia sp. Ae406_Ps2]|nr:hypothetical protein Ae406Ps2_6410 [Pseudonocardia sp. Ae406_Ps2]
MVLPQAPQGGAGGGGCALLLTLLKLGTAPNIGATSATGTPVTTGVSATATPEAEPIETATTNTAPITRHTSSFVFTMAYEHAPPPRQSRPTTKADHYDNPDMSTKTPRNSRATYRTPSDAPRF